MTEIPIRQAFSSRQDAEAARDRLEYGGFARSRVQLLRLGDEFVIIMYPQPEEREHAEDLINKAGWLPDWGRRMAENAPTPGQTLLGLALVAGAGAALYWAVSQVQQNSGGPRLGWRSEGGRRSSPSAGGASQDAVSRVTTTRRSAYEERPPSSAQAEVSDEPGARTASGGD